LLEPLDSTASPVTPFNATSLPQSSPHSNKAPSRVSLQRIQRPGLHFKTPAENPVQRMTAEEYKGLFDEEGRILDPTTIPQVFYNRDVDLEVIGDLWKLLLFRPDPADEKAAETDAKKQERRSNDLRNPDCVKYALKTAAERHARDVRNRANYAKVKRQWQATTPRQWRNYHDLRALVALLETDLCDRKELFEHFAEQDRPYVQRIAFNILLTLSFWNWDGALYEKGLITFLSPFLDSFIQSADCDRVIAHDGSEVPIEHAEADIFWCFAEFYDHNQLSDLVKPSKQPLLKPLFIAIGYILEANFADLLQLLYQKHAFSLDFLREDCAKWFTTCFQSSDVRRLWISILSFTSSFQFFQCFIVSLLFSLAPQFVEMNPLNSDEFVRRFHTLKKKVELNLLLINAANLMQMLHEKASQSK
jgi:hypothetical protein